MEYVLDSVWNMAGYQSLGIMTIENLVYPSSVQANTAFNITYGAKNTFTSSVVAFGYIQNITTGTQVSGSYWEQTVAGGATYPVTTVFSGITTTFSGEVRVGHIEGDTYVITTTINPTGSGAISLNPIGPSYASGTTVQVTASPNSGYAFTGWSGSISGTANPTTVVMDSNKSITANFTASSNYALTTSVSPVGAGTISLYPSGGSYASGTVVQLTAYPNTNYSFTGWSGSATGTTNPISITMNSNKSVTANFFSTAVCSSYTNPTDCINNGCYWWISDGKCHDTPEPSDCSTYANPYDCIQNDCYWWTSDNKCHGTPEVICSQNDNQPDECVAAGCFYNWSTNKCTSTPGGGIAINPMYVVAAVGAVLVVGLVIVRTSKGGKTKR